MFERKDVCIIALSDTVTMHLLFFNRHLIDSSEVDSVFSSVSKDRF